MPDLKRLPTDWTWPNFFRIPGHGNGSLGCEIAKSRQCMKGESAERGNVFCRAAGERGPATRRDEGPGETEGVSPGADPRGMSRHKRAPDESGAKGGVESRLLSSCSSLSSPLPSTLSAFGLLALSPLALTTLGFFGANTLLRFSPRKSELALAWNPSMWSERSKPDGEPG